MDVFTIGPGLKVLGWFATAVMAAAVACMFILLVLP
jgi:hypothetical protein